MTAAGTPTLAQTAPTDGPPVTSAQPAAPRTPIGPRTAGSIVFWLCAALLLGFLTGPAFLRSLQPPPGVILDFYKEWASVKNRFTGRAVYTHQRETIRDYLQTDLADPHAYFEEFNAHPPTAVALALPFYWLDYPRAQLAWNLVSLLAFAATLRIIVRELRLSPTGQIVWPLVALVLLCDPLRQTVQQGQLNLVLAYCITAAWAADRQGRPGWAGFFLAAATTVKLYPGFLLLYFVVRRDVRTLVATVISIIAITAGTALLLGTEAYVDYITKSIPALRSMRDAWLNVSLEAFWSKLFDVNSEPVIPLYQSKPLRYLGWGGSLALVIATCAYRCWQSRQPLAAQISSRRDLAFSLCIVGTLLASPITWNHYFVLLALPLALAWLSIRHQPWSVRKVLFHVVFWSLMLWPRLSWNLADKLRPSPYRPASTAASTPAQPPSQTPVHSASRLLPTRPVSDVIDTLTIHSYQFYALVALFCLLATQKPGERPA